MNRDPHPIVTWMPDTRRMAEPSEAEPTGVGLSGLVIGALACIAVAVSSIASVL